jgi:lipopolysaccharide cholinephosphotransferase
VVPKGKVSRLIHTVSEGLMGMLRTQRIPKRQSLSRVIRSSLLLALFPTKGIRWKVSSFCEKIVTKYNPPKEDDNVRYLLCRLHPYHYFKDVEWVDFEGEKMPVVKNYDRFLRTVYGDYMQLPPEDQRKPATDNLVFYDLDHSYLDYKGKYYCVKK